MQPIVVERFTQVNVKTKDFKGKQWVLSPKGKFYETRDEKLSDDKQKGSTLPLQFWQRKNNTPITGLVELTRIKTKHSVDDPVSRGAMDYAAPLYGEVVAQIPTDVFASVVAFEIDAENFKRSFGMDEITTILYTKKQKKK